MKKKSFITAIFLSAFVIVAVFINFKTADENDFESGTIQIGVVVTDLQRSLIFLT